MHIDLKLMVLAIALFAVSEVVSFVGRRYTKKGSYAKANCLFFDVLLTVASAVAAISAFSNPWIGAPIVLGAHLIAAAYTAKVMGITRENVGDYI